MNPENQNFPPTQQNQPQPDILPTGINTSAPIEPLKPELVKRKSPIFLILLGALFIGASYFLYTKITDNSVVTPTPVSTISITYLNNENGYSIKFPKTDYTRLDCIGEELTVEKYSSGNRASPMTITACERDSRYDLESKTYTSIQNEPKESKYYNIIKEDIQIGEVLGKLYIHTFTEIEDGPYPKWFVIARVNKNNKTYEIYFSDKSKIDLFYQILATFQFTN